MLGLTLSACGPGASAPGRVALTLVADGFASPVALVDPGDSSGRLFVADQTGLIWILQGGRRLDPPFLDLRSRLVELNDLYDERGLLGLAFHPDFARSGRFYVYYSAPLRPGLPPDNWDHTTYVSQFNILADDPDRADPSSERILLAIDKPGYNYEAGGLVFGPDGYLYIGTGDSVHDPASEAGMFAQDTSSLLGKILRIDVDAPGANGRTYGIPADNPFADGGGQPEIFAYGFRNPYRMSFDDSGSPQSMRLFVGDVGQASMEEADLVVAGGNYGWPLREGTTCFNKLEWSAPLASCLTPGSIVPIVAYQHTDTLSAIIGGFVYRGKALRALELAYVFGDWGRGDGRLFAARPTDSGDGLWQVSELQVAFRNGQTGLGQVLGFGRDADGELYVLVKDPGAGPEGTSGKVYELVAP
jgi:glucose/arabinose dehydrogenase